MEIQFVIVRSENVEYLCHNVNGTYVDVSDPSTEFVSGEDDFRLVEPDSSLTRKEYEFRGERFYLMPQFYGNGWLALTLQVWKMKQSISCYPSIWRAWMHSICQTVHLLM